MSETITTEEPRAEPRRLVRVHDDRWLGGVCAGLGRYFGLSPLVYRAAFAVLAFVGATGAVLYIAAWLVIPDEHAEDSIAVDAIKRRRDRPWVLFAVGVLAFALIVAASEVRFRLDAGDFLIAALIVVGGLLWWDQSARGRAISGPRPERRRALFPLVLGLLIAGGALLGLLQAVDAVDVDWRIAFAVGAGLAGVAVVAGAATGRAVAGVAALGLVLLVALAIAFAAPVPLFAGAGDRVERPLLTSGDRTYELGLGNLTVDLRDTTLSADTTKIDARLGIGHLVVRVPYGMRVDATAHADVGALRVFGEEKDGVGVREESTVYGGRGVSRALVVDADVGIGNVEVIRG